MPSCPPCLLQRERLRNIERICNLLRKLVLPEYSIHGLFCIMFLCAQEWLTVGLNIPLLFYNTWSSRYFHSPTDTKELLYDPASVMNGDTLKFCLKEAWCKLSYWAGPDGSDSAGSGHSSEFPPAGPGPSPTPSATSTIGA
ncbi:hypothetical protein NHX12_025675 [Muraenolepis orangiensis]|uniref:Uncharacterized protein n=1 Tax=Muraenolepis orangiensis TaxID=630683 RepID=A0A9Q0EF35_9TELE|nr:hypothetical protein NHX12_025675 [Muraenolepis orangiensis]